MVGKSGGVVNADVDELPPYEPAVVRDGVAFARAALQAAVAVDAMTSAALSDESELLDVNMLLSRAR